MAIVMVALLAFGGTYAYFTATTGEKSGVVAKTATVSLKNNTDLTDVMTANILPGDEVASGTLALESNSTVATYVFVTLTAHVQDAEGDIELFVNDGEGKGVSIIDIAVENEGKDGEWQKATLDDGTVVYYFAINETTTEGATTLGELKDFVYTITFSELVEANMEDGTTQSHNLYTDAELTNVYGTVTTEGDDAVTTTTYNPIMGVDLAIAINCSAIQQEGYNQAAVEAGTHDSLAAAIAAGYADSVKDVATR